MSDCSPFWPSASPAAAFSGRRHALAQRFARPLVLASGWPRARNFPHNEYEFRSESHFLYFVGRSIPGAALAYDGQRFRLFVTPPPPGDSLWHGPEPSLRELSDQLGLEVQPLQELPEFLSATASVSASTINPQDPRAASWLSEVLHRQVVPGAADTLSGGDAELADAVVALRLVADEAAVQQLTQAAEVTCRAHCLGMASTRRGLREASVCSAMVGCVAESGMQLAYSPIVTTHGQVLHSRTHHRVMQDRDLLLVDLGAETPEGWAADVTRTWPVSGTFSATQRSVYEVVLEAELAAIAAIAPGVRFGEIHRVAQRALTEGLCRLGILRGELNELVEQEAATVFFPHGVGHLIGVDVHDMEDLGDRAGYPAGVARGKSASTRYLRLDRVLEPGMVVTVEPGFYQIAQLLGEDGPMGRHAQWLDRRRLAEFSDVAGIRIEDDVRVTAKGCDVLSSAVPKTVAEVEQAMADRSR